MQHRCSLAYALDPEYGNLIEGLAKAPLALVERLARMFPAESIDGAASLAGQAFDMIQIIKYLRLGATINSPAMGNRPAECYEGI